MSPDGSHRTVGEGNLSFHHITLGIHRTEETHQEIRILLQIKLHVYSTLWSLHSCIIAYIIIYYIIHYILYNLTLINSIVINSINF